MFEGHNCTFVCKTQYGRQIWWSFNEGFGPFNFTIAFHAGIPIWIYVFIQGIGRWNYGELWS